MAFIKALFPLAISMVMWSQVFAAPKLLPVVTFTLSARELPNFDIFNGSPDPYVELYYADSNNDVFSRIGTTASLDNTNNPDWLDVFTIEFTPGTNQRLRFEIWDLDIDNNNDLIGTVEVTLSDIVNEGSIIERDIPRGCDGDKPCGRLRIARTLTNSIIN